jgi:hypothetical protein
MQYDFVQRKSTGQMWHAGHSLWGLVAAWNHATNPALFLSDREHARSSQYARAIKARMARLGLAYGHDYKELSNGSLWPVKRWRHLQAPL